MGTSWAGHCLRVRRRRVPPRSRATGSASVCAAKAPNGHCQSQWHPTCHFTLLLLVVAGLAAGQVARAQPPSLKFLRALQENGYGDMAVEYLKILKNSPEMPQAIAGIWDLEMSKSLRAAAKDAFDARERDQLMEESQAYLTKFIKEKPNHPEFLAAVTLWSDFPVKQAAQLIRAAQAAGPKNPQRQAVLLNEARAALAEVRAVFQRATEKYKAKLAELPPKVRSATHAQAADARQEMEFNLREALFQTALTDYYLAQTHLDPKGRPRSEALDKASQEFDDIYQANRDNLTGVYAHMWQGKVTEELGQWQTALDIYDEVLARAPDPGNKHSPNGLEPLFSQVEHFRLSILAKQDPKQFLSEANQWLKDYQRFKTSDGYQAIALEFAKTRFALAQEGTESEKSRQLGELLRFTTDMARVRSAYQPELILLRREILKALGRQKNEAASFDEAVALAEAAAANQQWEQALSDYNLALQLAEKKDQSQTDGVRQAISKVQYLEARDLFRQGRVQECLTMAAGVARERTDAAAAAPAAALAVRAALNLYASASAADRPKALAQLNTVAEFTEKHWPERPEADDARMARAEADLVVGQVAEAIAIFERVNPKSERYPLAAFLAGQNYWRRYLTEKAKPAHARDKVQMAADRAKAMEQLRASTEAFKRLSLVTRPPYLVEAQLLLAEIYAEGNQMAEAAALYQPLLDAVQAERPKTLDTTTMRVFLGAIRTYTALNDLDKASQIGKMLMELGPDTLEVNRVLIEFARLLGGERRKADAQLGRVGASANLAEVENAKKRLGTIQDMLVATLTRLAGRQQLSVAGMAFIAEALEALGMTAEAGREYRKILERTKTDPEFAKAAAAAAPRVRARLIGALRREGQFSEALKQVNLLIEEKPRALEPRMEKGRILEAWAEAEPAHYPEAVAHWTDLRNRLLQIRGKKPPEFYEVMYRVADCLVHEAQTSTDSRRALKQARQAEEVLKAALTLYPTLDGPETVARYKALLRRAVRMQGRPPKPG